MVMLELEAMGLDRVRTELSAQYVDHNLLQADFRNADDHLFLHSACQRFGLWYSKPGNGVSHPVHMQRFGIPGKTLLGSDSHTCAAGSLGMLAIGAGGLEVAMAMAGEPFHLAMPRDLGRAAGRRAARLGERQGRDPRDAAPPRRGRRPRADHRVLTARASRGLSAMDRHVIANMGAELGATTTVFPSDDEVRRFLASEDRERRLGRAARRRRRDVRHRRGDRPPTARAAHRDAVEPRQRRAGARGRRRRDLPVRDRVVGEPGPPRLRHRRADRRRPARRTTASRSTSTRRRARPSRRSTPRATSSS